MSIGHLIPEIRLFQPLTLKLQGKSHRCGERARSYRWLSILLIWFLSISHHQKNNSWGTAISKFDLETSKVKVMSEVKSQSHISYSVSILCFSVLFLVNWTSYSWDMAKIMFHLEKHNKFLVIKVTAVTFGQGHGRVIQYFSQDLYILCPKYLRFSSNV